MVLVIVIATVNYGIIEHDYEYRFAEHEHATMQRTCYLSMPIFEPGRKNTSFRDSFASPCANSMMKAFNNVLARAPDKLVVVLRVSVFASGKEGEAGHPRMVDVA